MSSPGVCLFVDSRNFGGIETHIAELALALRAAGLQPTVVLWRRYGAHPVFDPLTHKGVGVCDVGGSLTHLAGLLTGICPAALHTHGYKANLIGRIVARALGIRTVSTFHAGERPSGSVFLYDLIDRWTASRSASIAVSKPILARLPFGGVVVPNFVRLPDKILAPANRRKRIAFVGRLSLEKGPDLFGQLASRMSGVEFYVYGGGPMLDALRQHYGRCATFYGPLPSMDTRWQDVDLLAITSRAEGLPMVALEAMSHGIPVAGFGVGGLPELIDTGANGWLAPPEDLDTLQSILMEWATMPAEQVAEIGAAARRTIEKHHGPAAVIPTMRQLYGLSQAVA